MVQIIHLRVSHWRARSSPTELRSLEQAFLRALQPAAQKGDPTSAEQTESITFQEQQFVPSEDVEKPCSWLRRHRVCDAAAPSRKKQASRRPRTQLSSSQNANLVRSRAAASCKLAAQKIGSITSHALQRETKFALERAPWSVSERQKHSAGG